MEEIISDIGSTPSLEPVTDDNILDLFNTAAPAEALQQQQDSHDQQEESDPQQQSSVLNPTGEPILDNLPPKLHTCGFCGLVFSTYSELVEHRATHGGSRPYECHVCNKRFTQKAHLIIHRRTHTGEKPYSCHICHKRFSQTSHLNSHKRVHTGEKPFFCSLCNMGFCRRQRLEAHLQQHAKEVQQGFSNQNSLQQELMQQGMSSQSFLQQQQQQQQQQQLGASSEAAKDFLMSIGLGSVIDESEIAGRGASMEEPSASKEMSPQSRMTVFPGFNMGAGEGDGQSEDNKANITDQYDGDADRLSRSPTPCQNSAIASGTKSRRKPAFVRKLGYGQVEKGETKDDSAQELNDSEADASKLEMSAQAAAVRGMMRMATGSDCLSSDDLMNDLSAFVDSGSSNTMVRPPFPTSVSGATSLTPLTNHNHRNSLRGMSPEVLLGKPSTTRALSTSPAMLSSLIRTNNRVSLVDFTAEDLLRHLMSRDDVHRCDFCCVIFHDVAMYQLHRSMHDKMDIRRCSLCSKLLTDKYDFTAHFLSQHTKNI